LEEKVHSRVTDFHTILVDCLAAMLARSWSNHKREQPALAPAISEETCLERDDEIRAETSRLQRSDIATAQ